MRQNRVSNALEHQRSAFPRNSHQHATIDTIRRYPMGRVPSFICPLSSRLGSNRSLTFSRFTAWLSRLQAVSFYGMFVHDCALVWPGIPVSILSGCFSTLRQVREKCSPCSKNSRRSCKCHRLEAVKEDLKGPDPEVVTTRPVNKRSATQPHKGEQACHDLRHEFLVAPFVS